MKIKYYKHIVTTALLCASIAKISVAQEYNHCGTTEATKALELAHPELIQQRIDYNNAISQAILNKRAHGTSKSIASDDTTEYVIPIVFHIIHTYGAENISDEQVHDQMAILNRDYNKLNPDTSLVIPAFRHLIANVKITFRLAKLDPNGNCTNGIDRIYSHKTNSADDHSKLNQWPREKYLNVWVVKTIGTAGVAGYAFYPADVTGESFVKDGVLILYDYIGSVGASTPNTSRALTHEIGHWMSLEHPWGNNNDPGVACGDDLVGDTPLTKGHTTCVILDHYCTNFTIPGAASYNFDDVTTSSGMTDPTAPPLLPDTGITYSHFKAMGVSSNSAVSGMFSYANWDTGAVNGDTSYLALTGSINTGKYYEFTVRPTLQRIMSLSGITFKIQRNATGPRTYAVRSSKNNFASNLSAILSPVDPGSRLRVEGGNTFFIKEDTTSLQSGSKITLGSTYTNDTGTVTFRIYGFNAEDSTGTFGIDNVTLIGANGIIENVENYMDYSYCSKMFTFDQKERMRVALTSPVSGRNNLWTTANLIATGTDGSTIACAPKTDFFANRTGICAGSSVTYVKNMMGGDATSYLWSFPGGTPSSSTSSAASVIVSYPTAGTYPVTLTATNAAGSDSITKTSYIKVSPPWSDFLTPFSEDFEGDHFWNFWKVENLDAGTNTFGLSSSAGYSGTHSVKMGGYFNYAYDVDNLISPSFDLEFMSSATLTFRSAAASRSTVASDVTDQLKIYSSVDCGATWLLKKTIAATSTTSTVAYLINNGYHPESYVPSSTSEWALQSYTIPSSLLINNVRFKFEYTTGNASNNVYIDDININGTVGIDENALDNNSFSLYPNPTDLSTTLAYHLNKKGNVKIELMDILGKKIWETTNNSQTEGDYSLVISKPELKLNNGIYFIRLSVDGNSVTKKLIIQ